MSTFYLTIAKVHEELFSGEVDSVTLPAYDGAVTILAHHEPFVSTLKSGTIVVHKAGEINPIPFPVESGVVEVSNNQVTILI